MLGSRVDVLPTARAIRRRTGRLAATLGLLFAGAVGLAAPSGAPASTWVKSVRYHGYRLEVPASWPVYRLHTGSHVCVRFDRHAVYLGQPSEFQHCPAHALGRTEAILVQPLRAVAADASPAAGTSAPATPTPAVAGADVSGGSMARVMSSAHDVIVTATWRQDPATIQRALHVGSLSALARASRVRPAPLRAPTDERPQITPGAAAAPGRPGQVYTGAGFDVCSTPSLSAMAAWASAYRVAAVYIGGVNMACSQPNLTGAWLSAVSAAGWHLIPIYVGLQAPSNACGCGSISPSNAASEGLAAAQDAVAQAQARGLAEGNPLYFDMEGYTRSTTNSTAVLTFLSSWTQELHLLGYRSGVYSSEASGVVDLVSSLRSSDVPPDEIWIANWNGQRTTADANVPSSDWSNHQRVHQYQGGHNETHGGVTLNIDSDYVDAATAAASGAIAATAAPQSTSAPRISGTVVSGQTLIEAHGRWSGPPTSYTYQWQTCNSAGTGCAALAGARGSSLTLTPALVGHRVRVVETAADSAGTGPPATSAPSATVVSAPGASYWLFTARGNVYNGPQMAWYGSASRSGIRSITGLAATRDGRGYWLVDAAGAVLAYGDASRLPALDAPYPVKGIVGSPSGGYWLYTAHGNILPSSGTAWYGSAARARISMVQGMAATRDGRGYWLVDAAGGVFAYGDAASLPALGHAHPIRGIVAAPGGGYWLFTSQGNVYNAAGTAWYGSPSRAGVSTITGMASTPDGKGYWLVDAAGNVFAYGDARSLADVSSASNVVGIAR